MSELSLTILVLAAIPLIYAVALLLYVSKAAYWAERAYQQAEFQSRCLKLLADRDAQR